VPLKRLEGVFRRRAVDCASAADLLKSLGERLTAQAGLCRRLREGITRILEQGQEQVLGAGELIAALVGADDGVIEGIFGALGDVNWPWLLRLWSLAQFRAQPFQQLGRLKAVEFLERSFDEA